MVHIYIKFNICLNFFIKDDKINAASSLEAIGFSMPIFAVFKNAEQIVKFLIYYWNYMVLSKSKKQRDAS